jgi:hypothetical protein
MRLIPTSKASKATQNAKKVKPELWQEKVVLIQKKMNF